MNLNIFDSAKIIALDVLTQKWGTVAAHDELRQSLLKVHSIVMGTSDTFYFTMTLPSGRVHSFKIKAGKINHEVF